MTADIGVLAGIGAGLILVCLLPDIIAYALRHPERSTIGALAPASILSFLLWFALMVWAIGGKRNDSVIGRYAGKLKSGGLLLPAALLLVVVGAGTALLLR